MGRTASWWSTRIWMTWPPRLISCWPILGCANAWEMPDVSKLCDASTFVGSPDGLRTCTTKCSDSDGGRRKTFHESGNPRRRNEVEAVGGNRPQAEAHGGDRRPTDPMAHHAPLRLLRF